MSKPLPATLPHEVEREATGEPAVGDPELPHERERLGNQREPRHGEGPGCQDGVIGKAEAANAPGDPLRAQQGGDGGDQGRGANRS